MNNVSVKALGEAFFASRGLRWRELSAWHFCDNQKEADELAALVLAGEKRATSPSLWWFESSGEAIPVAGDFEIVTNWAGEAQCVIEIADVGVVPFNQISAEYAATEGEGDKSLAYWKRVHWDYYHRELEGTDYSPAEDMPIVCIEFNVVFRSEQLTG